jgi:hypothetical protein
MKLLLITAGLSVAVAGAAMAATGDQPLILRHTMQHEINPATMDVWDVGNNAMDDNGGIDSALLEEAGWARLEEAAGRLQVAALGLSQARAIRAIPAEESGGTDLGGSSADAVQHYLDADPASFREHAGTLASHAASLKEAAHNRDAARAGELVSGLDGVCEGCHSRFWYPES